MKEFSVREKEILTTQTPPMLNEQREREKMGGYLEPEQLATSEEGAAGGEGRRNHWRPGKRP